MSSNFHHLQEKEPCQHNTKWTINNKVITSSGTVLTYDKISDRSKLKQIADDILYFCKVYLNWKLSVI